MPHLSPVLRAAAAAVTALLLTATAASATATATSTTPVPSKKGVASSTYLAPDPAKLTRLNASWTYDWGSAAASPAGMEYVPMVWGSHQASDATVQALTRGRESGRFTHLLGFNEPDLHDQANLTPEQAVALWPKLQQTGLRLGSPAPAVANGAWLDRFMALATERGLRVDFIALHFYLDFTDPQAVTWLRQTLEQVHAKHRKPIWVTEIGAMDLRAWGQRTHAAPTHEAADRYLREATALLDSLDYVERYAWFADNCWVWPECRYSSLYDGSGALTSHGQLYASVPGRPVADPARPITGAGSGRCVDVAGAVTEDGTAVQLWDCNRTAAQAWQPTGTGELRALGKCLDVRGGGVADGTRVQLWRCNGTGAQRWTWGSDGQLRNPASGRCLDARDFGTGNGTPLQIWSCSGNSNQRWSSTA